MNNKEEIKKIEDLYDKRVETSQNAVEAAGQWGSEEYVPLICQEICKKIDLKKNLKVIEFGCGSGVLGNWIQQNCELYVGIDISFQMLKIFSNNTNNKKILLIKSTIDNVPIQNDYFDIVIINGVTMYINNEKILQITLDEIRRVATKKAVIFIGENITHSNYFWELSWFQNLSPIKQNLVKPYIKFRRWLAKKYPKLSGKYASIHHEISPKFIFNYFKNLGSISQSNSAAYTIKKKIMGEKYEGNRRVDFLIKLGR